MKIIDLLNKIANGEEVPEEILFCESEKYIYDNQIEDYRSSTYDSYCLFRSYVFDHPDRQNRLNKKVEIIEEEKKTKPLTKKDIEALGYACGEIQKCFTNGWTKSLETKPLEEEHKIPEKIKDKYCSQISKVELAQKYNEIIDYLEENNE